MLNLIVNFTEKFFMSPCASLKLNKIKREYIFLP